MSADSWIALIVLIVTILVLVTDRLPPVVVLGGAVGVLLFTNVIEPDVALSGLSSPAPATIAALYVLAGAATATGTFATLVDRTLGKRGSLIALTGSTAALSAVVPNTPLIAMFAPRVVRWAQRTGNDASRFLLPLSFASILGGVVTLIGTSTNLVVSDLVQQSGEEPFGVFEITVVGLPVAIVGITVLSTIGARLLPRRTAADEDLGRRAREFQMAARVTPDGPLVGRTIADSGLRNLDGVFLALIERHGVDGAEVVSMSAAPDTVLEAADVCCFVGDAGRVIGLHDLPGLEATEQSHVLQAEGAGTKVFEAVISPTSRLVGHSLRTAEFRSQYRGAVMAIHRADASLGGQLGRIPLRPGDVLLVLAEESFGHRWRGDLDFSLVASVNEPPPARRSGGWLVIISTIALVLIAATGLLSLFEAALLAAGAVILGGAITLHEGWRAINLNVVLTMAAAISLGAGVSQSGLAGEIAQLVQQADRLGFGDVGLVVAVMLATLVLTELLTNTAAAAVMVPIAMSVATEAGAEPRMLAVAVLIGASCSFLSPVGYQTNLMVYGLGGYKFSDFTRVGAPLTIATVITSAIIIPVAFG
ncbi:SLC13 family permease [Ilumatobacter sp.]|uniref:SLC13 family permease n=1 Tax=Ilumatobacter sp. TaxID=1967498 RepID=UPI003C5479FC